MLRQRPAETARGPLSAAGGTDPVRSLYLHVPFCTHKCHYCDFYSIVDPRDRRAAFVDRMGRELAALAARTRGEPLRSVFVGGGTPSLLGPALWRRLLETLRRHYDLSSPDLEFTVECNPESVTRELMDVLADGGVNRVSIGAQSFDRRHLGMLERRHDPENVERAVGLARDAGIARQSVDLIFGIPGQTPAEWERDLRRALALGTSHLSCYNLTYEPGTAMTARLRRGEFDPAREDDEIEMFRSARRLLREAGLERYEISNYARPGHECRHNLAYWRQDQWLAAGPGAAAHVAGHRWKNVPRLDDYLAVDDDGFAPIMDHEPPDPGRARRERIMTGLRLAEGLDPAAVLDGPGRGDLLTVARGYERRGLLTMDSARWRLTEAGVFLADRIAADLMAAAG